MLLRELAPEKYWSFPSNYTKQQRLNQIDEMIRSKNFYYQLKTDGNYSAFICDYDGDKRIISRGLSKVTNEYGRLENKLFFFEDVAKVFNKPTRIIGEIYLDNGVDKNVGSILRANELKAKSIQDEEFYSKIKIQTKFSPKDERDIKNNSFRGQKLKWRIFDVWCYDGIELFSTPWIERQKYVKMAAEKINNPLVSYVSFYIMDKNFYDKLGEIFSNGGEGVVCYNKDGLPEPGKRTAHKTCKIKREVADDIDCFIIGTVPATRLYTGDNIQNWMYWENLSTGQLEYSDLYNAYILGNSIYEPVTKNYFNNWCGAVSVGVYDNDGNIYHLCDVSGLEESFKTELRDNYKTYHLMPIKITGMNVSITPENNKISIRHPKILSLRENDIDIKDCTLRKVLAEN